ncbi:MAG: glucose-6-phosphate dehydrogenase [Chloroflexota bacterium]|nr:glucose-6-phosphate dehydrogenase [Chloroflexota bacterium]
MSEIPWLLQEEKKSAAAAPPVVIVIFGASGDLTQRKLVPALHTLACEDLLPEQIAILGVARSPMTDEEFRQSLEAGVEAHGRMTPEHCQRWGEFSERFTYMAISYDDLGSYDQIAQRLAEYEQLFEGCNVLFYLATPPQLYAPIVKRLGESGLSTSSNDETWRRIVIEKPFGHDLASARALNKQLHQVFDENQVYRIDHYLGKETVQNLLVFRFANAIFEPVWNRRYVSKVLITVAESVGVGHRGGYYDQAGVVRDMIQNHALQLLTLTAMEPPVTFNATALRNEKVKVLQAVRPFSTEDEHLASVRAQYRSTDGNGPTYRMEKGVDPESQTATYAALRLHIDNWRWQSIPFFVRSGKYLKQKTTDIAVVFKRAPHLLFPHSTGELLPPNILGICIQPDEGIHLSFRMKVPGAGMNTRKVDMEFHYESDFGDGNLPDAYERLLLDALLGDASLFARGDEIELSWGIVDPVLDAWKSGSVPLSFYEPGTWGPMEADELAARAGATWTPGCAPH